MIFYPDAFHVLTADVKDAVHLRIKEGCSSIVGDSFHLTFLQHKGGFYKCLPVACGTGTDDLTVRRHMGIGFLDGSYGGGKGISMIVVIK